MNEKTKTLVEQGIAIYQEEYLEELKTVDRWIKWCKDNNDSHGVNFYQGKRSALVHCNIMLAQFLNAVKELCAASVPDGQTIPALDIKP